MTVSGFNKHYQCSWRLFGYLVKSFGNENLACKMAFLMTTSGVTLSHPSIQN